MTIGEYWIDVISRYRITHTAKNEDMPYSLKDLLTDDFSKDVREIIYSKEFANELKTSIEKIPKNLAYTQDGTIKKEDGSTQKKEGSIRKIDNAIEEALCSFGLGDIKVADRKENSKTIHMPLTDSILYSKVLALFLYYGPLNSSQQDTYLCVDEGQDISLLQYGQIILFPRLSFLEVRPILIFSIFSLTLFLLQAHRLIYQDSVFLASEVLRFLLHEYHIFFL